MIPLVLVLLAAPQTPTPTPAVAPQNKLVVLRQEKEPVGGSHAASPLADLASRIKLKIPGGETRITNENLKDLASRSQLTMAGGAPEAEGSAGAGASAAEGRWQQVYQQARGYVAYLETEVRNLEGMASDFERRFYAEDDPAYRDGVLKPAWDKALVDLREREGELSGARELPNRVLSEARRDGALPGWFRGLPEPEPVSSFDPPWNSGQAREFEPR